MVAIEMVMVTMLLWMIKFRLSVRAIEIIMARVVVKVLMKVDVMVIVMSGKPSVMYATGLRRKSMKRRSPLSTRLFQAPNRKKSGVLYIAS
jgi:polyferredoxin